MNVSNNIKNEILVTNFKYFIFAFEFFEMMLYFGNVSILVLYSIKKYNFNELASLHLLGLYISLFCITPIISGYLSDKYLNDHIGIKIGTLFLILSCIFLSFSQIDLFYLGIIFNIIGAGFYKSIFSKLIGTIETNNIENNYKQFYLVLNVGAFIGAILFSFISDINYFIYFYIASACSIFLLYRRFFNNKNYKQILDNYSLNSKSFYIALTFIIFIMGLYFMLFELMNIIDLTSYLISAGIAILMFFFIKYKINCNVLFYFIVGVIFFQSSLQIGGLVTLFIYKNFQFILLGYKLNTMFFTSLNPLLIIFFSKYTTIIREEKKVIFSLVCCLLFFLCLDLTMFYHSNNYVNFTLIIVALCFISYGEILIAPLILDKMNHYAFEIPSAIMGIFYFSQSLAVYLGEKFNKYFLKVSGAGSINMNINRDDFKRIFLSYMVLLFVSIISLYIIKKSNHFRLRIFN